MLQFVEAFRLRTMLITAALLAGCGTVKIYNVPELSVRGIAPDLHLGVANHRALTAPPKYPGADLSRYMEPNAPAPGQRHGTVCKPGDKQPAACANDDIFEWDFNRSNHADTPATTVPPKFCLALSGGGLRSAVFSIGVMKGMQAKGHLTSVDVMSAVSGGGYAMSWYVAQKYWAYKNHNGTVTISDNDLFRVEGAHLRHLGENSSFYSGVRGALPVTLSLFPGSLLNLVANGIWGLHMNTALIYNSYNERIRDVFLSDPVVRRDGAARFIWMTDIKKYYKDTLTTPKHRPPYFVVNTTALIDDDPGHYGSRFANSVYEFTPLHFGSDGLGRYTYQRFESENPIPAGSDSESSSADASSPLLEIQRDWHMNELTSLSGAAFDGLGLVKGPAQKTLWSAFNLDLGRYIPNPRVKKTAANIAMQAVPLLYLAPAFRDDYSRDINGSHIYIADGGHSENLGAFSLIRRLCENIVIVDAEQDEQFQFGAYFKLRDAVRSELGAELRIDRIETITASCKNADVGCAATEAEEKMAVARERWRMAAETPVMHGAISDLPYCERVGGESTGCIKRRDSKELKVQYVKLAYLPQFVFGVQPETATASDCDKLPDFSPRDKEAKASCLQVAARVQAMRKTCKVRMTNGKEPLPTSILEHQLEAHFCDTLLDESRTVPLLGDRKTPFPQIQTTVQDFSAEQFDAYRNLGCQLGAQVKLPPSVAVGLVSSTYQNEKSLEKSSDLCMK
jgi:hypothetical protein